MSRPSGARVFIGNLSNRVSDREVEDKFSKYGRILKIDLKNGYGFVEYEHERDASDAIHGLNGADMDGMRVKVEHAKGPRRDRSRMPARSPENRVIVENIHHSVTWQTLKDYMRKAGDVMFADVVKDRGAPYGVVEFRTYDEMKRAIRKLDNTELNGSYIYMKEQRGRSRSRSRERYRPYNNSSSSNRRRSRSPRDRSPPRRERSPPRRRSRSPRDRSPPRGGNGGSKSGDRTPEREQRDRSPTPDRKRELSPNDRNDRSPTPKGSPDENANNQD
jgi:arginine/serine-rich splicing factor 4/5/6